jgi:hypothetical protein
LPTLHELDGYDRGRFTSTVVTDSHRYMNFRRLNAAMSSRESANQSPLVRFSPKRLPATERPFINVVPDEDAKLYLATKLREGTKLAGVERREPSSRRSIRGCSGRTISARRS